MSTTDSDPPADSTFTSIGPDAGTYERYAQVTLEADTILLYDREKEDAWITSDTAVVLTEAA